MNITRILSVCLLAGASAFGANLVADGTFEAGGAAWTTSGGASILNSSNCLGGGNFCAQFGSTFGDVSQYIPTVAGANYTISFWLRNTSSPTVGPDNAFHFQWDNYIPNPTVVIDAGSFAFTFFTVDMVADTNLTWVSFQGSSNTGTFLLDNISVDGPDGSVPEPSTMMLAIAGLGVIGARWRMRR